ncbi:MAG: methylated-DNA--[protein]-cysteine S-methyltransferase [Planctomycetes bacterium]|nr:methylated-DNA--[protein]-cysteine S-methyltransferase [Planctomycetota bacterium]
MASTLTSRTENSRRPAPGERSAAGKREPNRAAKSIFVGSVDTKLGRVFAAVSDAAVVAVSLPGEAADVFSKRVSVALPNCKIGDGGSPLLRKALTQLQQFFEGKRRMFDLPLRLGVTAFAQRVLDELACVPFGETATYGDLAKRIGSPRASRAVGLALSKNPAPIVLPCHRIIASDGGLGGFAGKARALDMKRRLLAHEREK